MRARFQVSLSSRGNNWSRSCPTFLRWHWLLGCHRCLKPDLQCYIDIKWDIRIAWRGTCLVRLSSSENQGGLSSEPGSVTWALGLADSGCIEFAPAICPAIRSHGWGTGGLSGGFSLLRAEFNMARQVAETSLDMLDIAWCFWKGCSWRKADFVTNGQAFMSVYNSTCFLGATLAKHQALWKMSGLAAFFRAWRCLIFGEYLESEVPVGWLSPISLSVRRHFIWVFDRQDRDGKGRVSLFISQAFRIQRNTS